MPDISSISREAPVLIAGPTASGKSALAMALADRDDRMIVNADALQVFGNWRVLTARPSVADEAAIPHAMYGHIPRDAPYSVGHWLREVATVLNGPVVIVGGTGLYLSALTEGLAEIPPIPPQVRVNADTRRLTEGTGGMLAELDPSTRARIDTANPARVQRAWEVLNATGRGLADWQADTGAPLLPLNTANRLTRPSTSAMTPMAQASPAAADSGRTMAIRPKPIAIKPYSSTTHQLRPTSDNSDVVRSSGAWLMTVFLGGESTAMLGPPRVQAAARFHCARAQTHSMASCRPDRRSALTAASRVAPVVITSSTRISRAGGVARTAKALQRSSPA